jgi:Sodium:sulfate symporter transmembrane region
MAIDTRERERREDDQVREELGRGGTYRTLDEQEGRLSSAEERFERRRRTIGLFLGPIVLGAMLLIPFDLDGNQHRLLAILSFVVVWWVTEAIPIPITALLGVTLCALLEATPPPPEGDSSVDVVFSMFTDDTIFLFIGVSSSRRRWSCTGCTGASPTGSCPPRASAAPPTASSWPSA